MIFHKKVLRKRKKLLDDYNNLIKDVIIIIIFILISLCCLYTLNVFSNQNHVYNNNKITSKYMEYIFTSDNRQITLDKYNNYYYYYLKNIKVLNKLIFACFYI